MAERRMFAKTVVDSDAFLDMPLSTQALYFHLAMRGDDDGFVNNPKKIMRMIGSSDDEMKVLLGKRFIIGFENGVIVIKHWKIHNYIQRDRYKPTVYQTEMQLLSEKDNKAYTMDTGCIQDVRVGKDSIGKVRQGKESIDDIGKIIPPSIKMVREYCIERRNSIDPETFVNFYKAKGWKIGKEKMKDWKACVITWEKKNKKETKKTDLPINSPSKKKILDAIYGEDNGR